MAHSKVPPELVISPELARAMTELSLETGRQIGVLLSRAGRVEYVVVGDSRGLVIPSLSQVRVGGGRLKGLRCVHTHLAGEGLSEDDLLDLACLRLDLMAVLKILPDGLPERLYSAHLLPNPKAEQSVAFLEPVAPTRQPPVFLDLVEALEAELTRLRPVLEVERNQDRAILISVSSQPKGRAQESMDELSELVRSDEVEVVDTVIQRRERIQPRTILGKGKLAEIMLKALRLQANLLVFDQELNPSQVRSITDHSDLRVIDRTQLILDIFARRALSREGKLQVEMAQLKYMLPRLVTRDDALSRLTGGIGGRGPGETKLEVDRRRIDDRINNLAKQLKAVARERHQRRSRRRKRELPVVSLVGYTNTGKSTLLNMLTRSAVTAEDKLFATLDPTSRRLRFPEDFEVIVTDTVGFIRNLPDELMQAFKSTLEELHEADVLVHVIDLANPRFSEQVAVVETMLRDLGLDRIPQLRLLNKVDLVDGDFALQQAAQMGGVLISAMDPASFGPFLEQARRLVMKRWERSEER